MGLDIGFTIYEKEPLEKEGKFVQAEINQTEDNWRCGWGKPNESWGSLFKFGDTYEVPVFQEGLDGKKSTLEEFSEEYKLVDFDEFADYVHEACTNEYHEASEQRNSIRRTIAEHEASIKELRELQRCCTEENAYAFDRWASEIKDLKDRIGYLKDQLSVDDFVDEHQAESVNALLELMEKYLKEDRYYIVPYFSC